MNGLTRWMETALRGVVERGWTALAARSGAWGAVVAAAACVVLAGDLRAAGEAVDADILLVGGTLFDGAGAPAVVGDLAIRGDRIVAVGAFDKRAVGVEIDCRGKIVAPGFIDLHNHSDAQVVDRQLRANINYLLQGCTTIVTGNCGSGPIEVGDYYRRIDESGCGTNVAHLIPQGDLRNAVLGRAQRAATPPELEKMLELTERGMDDGAWGLSTGLIYVPSSYADAKEISLLAEVVGRRGGIYASHIRGEGVQLLAAVQEALDIGAAAGTPVHISHFKSSGREAWGLVREAAARIEAARAEGRRVTADQYPYIASSTSLEATLIPTWAQEGGADQLAARLNDPEQGPRIRDAMQTAIDRADDGARIKLARYAKQPSWAGRSLAEIAQANHTTPLAVALEITRGGGAAVVNFGMNEEDVQFVMALPWVATASDGRAYLPGADRPHPRSYGTFPRKLGRYALRDRIVSLDQAIRSATSLPAEILGMTDRGTLEIGKVADVVVISLEDLEDRATFDDPHQYARGTEYVFVAGQAAVWNGTPTGALPGRALRRPTRSRD